MKSCNLGALSLLKWDNVHNATVSSDEYNSAKPHKWSTVAWSSLCFQLALPSFYSLFLLILLAILACPLVGQSIRDQPARQDVKISVIGYGRLCSWLYLPRHNKSHQTKIKWLHTSAAIPIILSPLPRKVSKIIPKLHCLTS